VVPPAFNVEPQRSGHDQENNLAISKHNVKCSDVTPRTPRVTPKVTPLMERSFADATNCHGLKRARWRGLWRQAIQDLLIAIVQNLRKLIRHLSQSHPERAGHLSALLSLFLDRPSLLFAS